MKQIEIFYKFIGKRLTIYLINGKRFTGLLESESSNFVCLKDRFVGLKLISKSEISNLEICGEIKNERKNKSNC